MGATPEDSRPWGTDNEYGAPRDVLLGRPDYYRWVDAGPITNAR